MKKIVSIFLVILIAISCFSLPVYADSNDDVKNYLNNYKGKKFPDLPDFANSNNYPGEFDNNAYKYIFFYQTHINGNEGLYYLIISNSPLNLHKDWFGPSYNNRLFLGTDSDFRKCTPVNVYRWSPDSLEEDYQYNWVEAEESAPYYYGFEFHSAFTWDNVDAHGMYSEHLTRVDFLYADTDIKDIDDSIFFLRDKKHEFYEHATERFGSYLPEYTGNDSPDFGGIIGSALNKFSDWLAGFWESTTDAIKSIPQKLIDIWESIKGLADKIKDALSPLFDGIKDVLNNVWESIKGLADDIKTALSPLFDGIKNVISEVKDGIAGIASAIGDVLKELFIPADGYFNDKFLGLKEDLESKMPFIGQFFDFLEQILSLFVGSAEPPEFNFTYKGTEYNIFDFSVFAVFRTLIHFIVLFFAYYLFIKRTIRRIPTIIGGLPADAPSAPIGNDNKGGD